MWSKGKDQTAVAASLGVAVDILKQVYSECPSFDEIVPALISAGIHALPAGPVGYCSPPHRIPFNSRNEGSRCVG